MSTTLYWHDYETFGVDPKRDRPAQFAGLRTDTDLNIVGEPLVVYCKPATDMLPHPEASLLTGITPQLADQKGMREAEFITQIHDELSKPGTCGAGYNSLRFDDEVTRHVLYRNFFDPYAREWQYGNSRWDLIDLARMTFALRPQGIIWPTREDGSPSFRLEDLTAANEIGHDAAHDALSDVHATIGLARLIRDRQPRLYEWLFQLRNKKKAMQQLDIVNHTPVLHTSSMYRSDIACTSLVMPLSRELHNQNSVLVYDLRHDPEAFLDLREDQLNERLFTPASELAEGMQRLPVKSVKINKCPALAPYKTLNEEAAERIGIDLDECERNGERLRAHPDFMQRVAGVYSSREFPANTDVDIALYDGFFGDADRTLVQKIRNSTPQQLSKISPDCADQRIPELLFRYRARNWPDTLSNAEMERWESYRRHRLLDTDGGGSIAMDEYTALLTSLRSDYGEDAGATKILDALDAWGKGLLTK